MDNERDALERTRLIDADEKQWQVELMSFELEKLNLQKEIAQYNNSVAALENERILLQAQESMKSGKVATVKISCRKCGAELEYSGYDENVMKEIHENFTEAHKWCE